MPIHDWTLVDAGIFHDFHTAWIGELRKVLNRGILPDGYYALAEQQVGRWMIPDILTLREPEERSTWSAAEETGGGVALAPPTTAFTMKSLQRTQAERQRMLAIRHGKEKRLVAMIEIVSPGNKASQQAFDTFVGKVRTAMTQGIHQLIVDLFPPGPRDPDGIHGAVWEGSSYETYEQPPTQPLTLVAYECNVIDTAYVQPASVGETLLDMPLFLKPDWYVNVPLEATYHEVYLGVPKIYREVLEGVS